MLKRGKAMLDRVQCYEYGSLFASITDLANSDPRCYEYNPTYTATTIESGKEFLDNIEKGYNYMWHEGRLEKVESFTMYSFFMDHALRFPNPRIGHFYEFLVDKETKDNLEGPRIARSNFLKFKKTLDMALDKMINSKKARELISYVFENLARTSLGMIKYSPGRTHNFAA